jgi:hypothetical protein
MGTEKYSNDETQQSESAINKVSPVKKVGSRKILITTLLVLLVIGVVGGVGYYFLRKKGPQVVEPTIEKAKENNTPSIPAKKEAPKKEVFFVENNKLWGVDAEGKKTEIDSGVTSAGGSVLSGSDFPLTSADLTKAAYIKNGTVWVYESDGEKKQKIDQPTVTKFNDKYSFQTIAWSTNGENLLFSLNFECGMMCEDNEVEDASITGTYWYSLKNNKSKKLSIKGEEISMWFPNKEEFVYIKDNKLFSYDVNSDSSEVITVTPFKTNTLQLSFSDDGSTINYAEAFDSQSRIVIANPDNTGQQVLKTGG